MSRLEEIIKDFIEIGYNYSLLHDKYVKEMQANQHTLGVQDSPGHDAQMKLMTLHNMWKNGELPSKPEPEKKVKK